VNTLQDRQAGFHGQVVLSGGSFESAGTFGQGQYIWGKNVFGASASGGMTSHYLNPVVVQNYTNRGTLGDFSADYQRDLTPKDRLSFIVRHELSRYQLPNEQFQQAAAQLQTADNLETMGIVSYQHIFSPASSQETRSARRAVLPCVSRQPSRINLLGSLREITITLIGPVLSGLSASLVTNYRLRRCANAMPVSVPS